MSKNVVDLSRAQRASALDAWLDRCKQDFNSPIRYPNIEFLANNWNLGDEYKAYVGNLNLEPAMSALKGVDESYSLVFRCVAAEAAISCEVKGRSLLTTLKRIFMTLDGPESILDLNHIHLRNYEQQQVDKVAKNPASGVSVGKNISDLEKLVERLRDLGVIDCATWRITAKNREFLRLVLKTHINEAKQGKGEILDRKIEAFSDASNEMFSKNTRLSNLDRSCIAFLNIEMCAPSRVNEVLCMQKDDFFTAADYALRADGQRGSLEIQRTHLLLLQKGSKGAPFSAKPVLNFMIDLCTESVKVILEGGARSRMVVEWYENNPDKIYLAPGLEHIRGKPVDRGTLWQIMQMTSEPPNDTYASRGIAGRFFKIAKRTGIRIFMIDNPRPIRSTGTLTSHKLVQAVSWEDAERYLMGRVNDTLKELRQVTRENRYNGPLSMMLGLVDLDEAPYLPGSIKYATYASCFKTGRNSSGSETARSVFEKLNLTMVVNGVVQFAEMDTHDPRHWLNTQALAAKEGLSDVLINKWANRHSLHQMTHYDHRTATEKANQAAMPVIEMHDISGGLEKMESLSTRYGLNTCHLTVNDARISMTSMDAIMDAIDDRPVARSGSQLIIAYPTKYGVCFHEHHVVPCRSYACVPCDSNHVVKGHLPTNEAVFERYQKIHQSIVSQLDRLVTAHNRGIADVPEGLESHMVALIAGGISVEAMTDKLIDDFHEIKDRIKSPALRNKLEEAFAAKGFVERLQSSEVAAGALIRYHNPSRHGFPGHEIALDSIGGRKKIAASLDRFNEQHPQFAPKSLASAERAKLLTGPQGDEEE